MSNRKRIYYVALAPVLAATAWLTGSAQPAAVWPGFGVFQEFSGANGYTDPQVVRNLNLGMMTGLTFHPPVGPGVGLTTSPFNAGLMLRLAASPLASGLTASAIDLQQEALSSLVASQDAPRLWDLMPEWDQAGGPWVPKGHPSYRGLTRQAAHGTMLNFYRSSFPEMISYLGTLPSSRRYMLAAVTDYPANVYDAYELGVEMQMLERGNDELGDLATGIAYLRGAANQYGRNWGIDLATWRSTTNSATAFNANGALVGGWSASYVRRELYLSYLAGAQVIQNEATAYSLPNGQLNPFGEATREFADFALRRHPDLGHPYVPVALLVDPDSGFDSKHGVYNQYDYVWYQNIPFAIGDSMTNQFYRLAYPNHWLHGLAPGAPFADSAGAPDHAQFVKYLAAGNDPRPYEPMPTTRWGDQIDILTANASAGALSMYPVIVMMGGVKLDERLRTDLENWVAAGGTLVMNASQAAADDLALAGVSIASSALKTSTASKWVPGNSQTEASYRYTAVQPNDAQVWAVTGTGDPLITRHSIGAGQVIFTAAANLMPVSNDRILTAGIQLFDYLFQQVAAASISGPPIAYVINQSPGKLVVGLVNPGATDWNGTVSGLWLPVPPDRVLEYVTDQAVDYTVGGDGTVSIPLQVPAFDLKVIAVEYTSPSTNPGNGEKKSRSTTSNNRNHAARPFQKN